MKKGLATVVVLALAACTPPPAADNGAEATVRDIYTAVQSNIGRTTTPLETIPMTDELRDLIARAQAAASARDEPFIAGDVAANCQDCVSLTDLEVGAQTGPEPVPAEEGHRLVEARFILNGAEPRAVIYDLVETPQGWRVDNILAEGFDLRAEAQAYLDEAPTP